MQPIPPFNIHDHWVYRGWKNRMEECIAFIEKHGPDEPMLRHGRLTPAGELLAQAVARMLET